MIVISVDAVMLGIVVSALALSIGSGAYIIWRASKR
jgi:hypothetical protein